VLILLLAESFTVFSAPLDDDSLESAASAVASIASAPSVASAPSPQQALQSLKGIQLLFSNWLKFIQRARSRFLQFHQGLNKVPSLVGQQLRRYAAQSSKLIDDHRNRIQSRLSIIPTLFKPLNKPRPSAVNVESQPLF